MRRQCSHPPLFQSHIHQARGLPIFTSSHARSSGRAVVAPGLSLALWRRVDLQAQHAGRGWRSNGRFLIGRGSTGVEDREEAS